MFFLPVSTHLSKSIFNFEKMSLPSLLNSLQNNILFLYFIVIDVLKFATFLNMILFYIRKQNIFLEF